MLLQMISASLEGLCCIITWKNNHQYDLTIHTHNGVLVPSSLLVIEAVRMIDWNVQFWEF